MSAADSTVLTSDRSSSLQAEWDELTPGQIAARNPSAAQRAARFQAGKAANPAGTNQYSKPQPLGLFDFFAEAMLDDEQARLKIAAVAFADEVANLHPVWFKEFLSREWPTINKLQAEVLHADVRQAPELPDTDAVRREVAEALDADYEVIDEGEE